MKSGRSNGAVAWLESRHHSRYNVGMEKTSTEPGQSMGEGGAAMRRGALTAVLKTIEALEPEELQQVQQAVQARLGQKRYPPEEERFLQALLDAGVIREIKPPRSTPVGERRRIQASGKPVSETLLEERR
jgi:hypothetical protein